MVQNYWLGYAWFSFEPALSIPCRQLTHPTWRTGKSSSKVPWYRGYVSLQESTHTKSYEINLTAPKTQTINMKCRRRWPKLVNQNESTSIYYQLDPNGHVLQKFGDPQTFLYMGLFSVWDSVGFYGS